MLVPAVAEILCPRCGARTEAVLADGRASVDPCPCGGMRQVVRIARHRGGDASVSPTQVDRSVRLRADKEVLPRGRPHGP
jgi:hypothetical protein